MRIFSYLILLIIIILGLTFAILNAEPVTLNYYIGAKQVSLSLVAIFALGLGVVLGFIASLIPFFRLKRKNFKLKNRIKQIEQEVENLRSIPIKDSH